MGQAGGHCGPSGLVERARKAGVKRPRADGPLGRRFRISDSWATASARGLEQQAQRDVFWLHPVPRSCLVIRLDRDLSFGCSWVIDVERVNSSHSISPETHVAWSSQTSPFWWISRVRFSTFRTSWTRRSKTAIQTTPSVSKCKIPKI
jgi:hypothetical protein